MVMWSRFVCQSHLTVSFIIAEELRVDLYSYCIPYFVNIMDKLANDTNGKVFERIGGFGLAKGGSVRYDHCHHQANTS